MQACAAMAAVAELTSFGSNLHSKINLFNSSNACDHKVMKSILIRKYTVSMYVCMYCHTLGSICVEGRTHARLRVTFS